MKSNADCKTTATLVKKSPMLSIDPIKIIRKARMATMPLEINQKIAEKSLERMMVSTLTGTNVDPVEMAQWSYENGYYCPGGGSYHSLIPKAAEHRGLSVDMNLDGENVADALAEGKLVVAIMSKGHFTKSGHFIVLRGITADGKVLVADPASLKRSNQEWDLSLILEEARKRVGAGGPFWAISN